MNLRAKYKYASVMVFQQLKQLTTSEAPPEVVNALCFCLQAFPPSHPHNIRTYRKLRTYLRKFFEWEIIHFNFIWIARTNCTSIRTYVQIYIHTINISLLVPTYAWITFVCKSAKLILNLNYVRTYVCMTILLSFSLIITVLT